MAMSSSDQRGAPITLWKLTRTPICGALHRKEDKIAQRRENAQTRGNTLTRPNRCGCAQFGNGIGDPVETRPFTAS